MTELMISMRRSPRTLLERDGHPGPGPGRLALVMARAGVGKTAFLVGIGIDGLLSGQKVLHISLEHTVDKVRGWYEDVLTEMLRREKKMAQLPALQLELERRRHIHVYAGDSFSVDRLRQAVDLLAQAMEFQPQVIVVDGLDLGEVEVATVYAVRAVAAAVDAELWMSCLTHRGGPEAAPGHLPPPAERIEQYVDLAVRLDPHDAKVRLHVLKDSQEMVDKDLNIVLDPKTLLLVPGVAARR
jgi:hypothetical protein